MFFTMFKIKESKLYTVLDEKERQKQAPAVVKQPDMVLPIITSEFPESAKCPQCNQIVITRVSRKIGKGTWIISSSRYELNYHDISI
jgi:hypothetical protein